jgi:hypothetical protein
MLARNADRTHDLCTNRVDKFPRQLQHISREYHEGTGKVLEHKAARVQFIMNGLRWACPGIVPRQVRSYWRRDRHTVASRLHVEHLIIP